MIVVITDDKECSRQDLIELLHSYEDGKGRWFGFAHVYGAARKARLIRRNLNGTTYVTKRGRSVLNHLREGT